MDRMHSLADAILQEDFERVQTYLRYQADVNEIDQYGFRPLIEAAIVNNTQIAQYLLDHGAEPNQQDVTGGSALQWASENNNVALARILLKHGANPNLANFSGQSPLVMPLLRQQDEMKTVLLQAGANLVFAQDFINTKLLGHIFELVGTAEIVDPYNQFIEVDFEGFFLEVTLGLIADSLRQFQNHFAARTWRRYMGVVQFIVQTVERASALIRYQQYRVDRSQYQSQIDELISQEPLIIPVGYEGHAITFIKYGEYWVKCDRREDSRLYDNVMIYRIANLAACQSSLIKKLIYTKNDSQFINHDLDQRLQLIPFTELQVEAQMSGNCSWANVEAVIPAVFFLVLMQLGMETNSISFSKTTALKFFHLWREWNKERALQFCIQRFQESDKIRKACHAEVLASILFQRCDGQQLADKERINSILSLLLHSPYEYILKNYLRIYYYEQPTEEGKRFAELLKKYGYLK